jgi:DNA-3-methyladenine glycosylase II
MIPPSPIPVVLPRGTLSKLGRADPNMAKLIRRVGRFRLEAGRAGGHLAALVRSIVYQQLSGKAAATIHARFAALFHPHPFPDAHAILAMGDEALRACGLSRQKIASLRDLCARVASGSLPLHELGSLPDAAITRLLTEVRGIGRWSAEMFLMFHLGRLDVWPAGDLGIQKGVIRLYALRRRPSAAKMETLGEPFRPFRSVASWYLWRLVDGDAGDW